MHHPQDFLDEVSLLLKEANAIVLNRPSPAHVTAKKDRTVSSDLDQELHAFFTTNLSKKFPGHKIISEEDADWKSQAFSQGYVWIIDPLDGSTNYSHNFPVYGMSIGLLKDGMPVFGGLALPKQNVILCADESGAYNITNSRHEKLVANKKRRPVKEMVALLDCGGATESRKRFRTSIIPGVLSNVRTIRIFGSATVSIASIIKGYDAFVGSDMHLYDVIAGVVAARAAGLGVYNFNGDEWSPQTVGDILITDPTSRDSLVKLLKSM